MKTSKLITGMIAGLTAIALGGCGLTLHFEPVETGPIQTEAIRVPRPEDSADEARRDVWDVELSPGVGTVHISPDGVDLIEGVIDYNVVALKPEVSVGSRSVRVRQGNLRGNVTFGRQVVNDWRIRLGKGIPMNLSLQTGATKGVYDLGGLSLRSALFNLGATETVIDFSQANPVSLDTLTVNGGAASVTLNGLGNLNIQRGTISAGAGELKLRFDGDLRADAQIDVKGGVSSIEINSGGNPVQVIFTSRMLTGIDAGNWDRDGQTYSSPEVARSAGPRITVRVDMGIGSVKLVTGG